MVDLEKSLKVQALEILETKKLKNKLQKIEFSNVMDNSNYELPLSPGRDQRIQFSQKRLRFPKNFESPESKARALHAFANHELLAIEIMCYALIKFPENSMSEEFKKDLIETIEDEQKHFSMYEERINELGFEFGDFAINDFFWKHALKMERPSQFSAFMSMTFEMANLDFANFYKNKFLEVGDKKTAAIMQTVFSDEIKHVKCGVKYLDKWRGRKDVWNYYLDNLIFPLTPSRSKGVGYQDKYRKTVGLDDNFIKKLNDFDDGFKITQRKQ